MGGGVLADWRDWQRLSPPACIAKRQSAATHATGITFGGR
jgi:hypothetical protein